MKNPEIYFCNSNISKNQPNITKTAIPIKIQLAFFTHFPFPSLSLSFILRINDISKYITLTNTAPITSTVRISLNTLTLSIFCNTDVVKVIPPTNAKTIDANMPKIVTYSLSIPTTWSSFMAIELVAEPQNKSRTF